MPTPPTGTMPHSLVMIFGCAQDKDIDGMLKQVALGADKVFFEELGLLRRRTDERGTERFTPVHGFDVAVELIQLDIPVNGMRVAGEAIERHMSALAGELTGILHDEVVEPWRRGRRDSPDAAAHLETTIATLRRLTLEAIVRGFQRSANSVIARDVSKPERSASGEAH